MQRRDFLKLASLSPAVCALPGIVHSASQMAKARYLILLELKGGNDGLNTIVPYRDPLYTKLRPTLALQAEQIIPITEQLGLHNSLQTLKPLWDKNQLAIVSGVGYPDPNRSHFRSIEIWETASSSNEYLEDGWIAPYRDLFKVTSDTAADAVVIGNDAGPLAGDKMRTVMMQNMHQFLKRATNTNKNNQLVNNAALAHILSVRNDTQHAAHRFEATVAASKHDLGAFPKHSLGSDFETVARMIASDAQVPVIKISHGSFDTHANQLPVHARLLEQMSESLAAFQKAMQKVGLWDQVLVMTYSEFGRRVKENASRGTDHGTAAPHFLLGGKVQGGLYGQQPSLADLDNNDLKFSIDYRSVYNTVARQWWSAKPDVLSVRDYPLIDCLQT